MLWPDGWDFLVLALAAWRLAHFLVRERGPWDVALRLRAWAGIEHDEDGTPESWPEGGVAAPLLACIWCCSAWTAALMLALWLAGPGALIVLALGIAGGAMVVDATVGRLQHGNG